MQRKRRIEKVAAMGMLACPALACQMGGSDAATEEEAVAIAELIGNVTVGPLVELWVGEAILEGEFDPQAISRRVDTQWYTGPDGRLRQRPWSDPGGQSGKFDREWECPEGGTVRVSGNNKERGSLFGENGRIFGGTLGMFVGPKPKWHGDVGELRVKAKFDSCARTSREGLALALTGTVEKELAKTFIHDGTKVVIGMRGDWNGKVAWEDPDAGRSGVCKIDGDDPGFSPKPIVMDMSLAVEHGSRSQQVEGGVEGFMCGQPVYTEHRTEWLSPFS